MSAVYKSHPLKLLSFFEKSRDKWKARAKKCKAEMRNLDCKLKYHQQKHDSLKKENKSLKAQLLAEKDKKKDLKLSQIAFQNLWPDIHILQAI